MSNGFVVLMGIGIVFFGLICLVVLSYLISALCRIGGKPVEAAEAPGPVRSAEIPNRQAMIAAVSAAVAEELGTNPAGIRILSLTKIR